MPTTQKPASGVDSLKVAMRGTRSRGRRAARRLLIRRGLHFPLQRRAAKAIEQARANRPALTVLTPDEALRENGFTVFRGLFPAQECARLAAEFKSAARITEGEHWTCVDSTNRVPQTREVLFDERLLGAVRASLRGEARFLQASDLHYMHDTAGWHRDSVHRLHDNSATADWGDRDGPYAVVKAILYLESDNAAMGVVPGSHLSPIAIDRDFVKMVEKLGGQTIVGPQDEPNRRLSPQEKRIPMAWKAMPGDVLVFDERMYHAGRRVDDGQVTTERKFCLSLTFGSDNMHSYRYFSYFRYARKELGFVRLTPDYLAALRDHDLVLDDGLDNYYENHLDELRLVHLRNPEKMDELVEQVSRAAAAKQAAHR